MITDPKTVPDRGRAGGPSHRDRPAGGAADRPPDDRVRHEGGGPLGARPGLRGATLIELVLSAERTRPAWTARACGSVPPEARPWARRRRSRGGRNRPRLRRRPRGGTKRGPGRRLTLSGGELPEVRILPSQASPRSWTAHGRADRAGDPRVGRCPRRRGRPADVTLEPGEGRAHRSRSHPVRDTTAALRAHVRALDPERCVHRAARAGRGHVDRPRRPPPGRRPG